jgi:GNAT superfamily N-acetyltransferase
LSSPSRLSGTVELAARIEGAEVELLAACAEAAKRRGAVGVFRQPIAGGIATWIENGSPLDKVAGLGFAGVPSEVEMTEVESIFDAGKAPVQVELSSLADPAVAEMLGHRGYQYVGIENVLALELPVTIEGGSSSLEVRPSDDSEVERWLNVVVTGFASPDTQGVPSVESFPRDALERTMRDMATAGGFRRTLAWSEDGPMGGGAMRISTDGVAQLCGAATLPQFRRRGVQGALLAARLQDAAALGCTLAVVTTQPGSTSQQNVERHGFQLVAVRAILVRGLRR